eukprot:CAMPEP_0172491660 /NCGR_PEP_ID=MMETSP1066-20121228/22535_1 /TAXON_ID=671091 /ORGANISM="Coscinodiscus wailesii, Strain CCMP2513" /LENGTH=470 /DNA_ID=CAMNT_0013260821 /DNA_START=97 /DNA_END=1506 /DNA_ORIENTATION=-
MHQQHHQHQHNEEEKKEDTSVPVHRLSSEEWPEVTSYQKCASQTHNPVITHFDKDEFDNLKLTPHHDSTERKSNLVVATFNLVATIIGGSVFSLPLGFEKAGIVPATGMMILAAVITDFSLYILCSCARRTGAGSFGEVGLHSFGPQLFLFTSLLLFVFLLFVLVAYMVLVRDIWTPIVNALFVAPFSSSPSGGDGTYSLLQGNITLLVIVASLSPFLLRKELHALRYNCYVGFASITVLCIAIIYRAWEKACLDDDDNSAPAAALKWYSTSLDDLSYAFPLITLNFLCSFNIIGVQASLINPTRRRVRYVIDGAVGASFLLTYAFGLAGYLYARGGTEGNILLNFDFGDKLILLGRAGSGLTIVCAMPMMTLPCREAILEFVRRARSGNMGGLEKNEEEEMALFVPDGASYHAVETTNDGSSETDTSGNINDPNSSSTRSQLIHVGTTFAIISTCYLGAVAAPGVATVW